MSDWVPEPTSEPWVPEKPEELDDEDEDDRDPEKGHDPSKRFPEDLPR